MTVLLPLLLAAAAPASDVADTLGWHVGADDHPRWYVEADVVLPQFLWFTSDFNKQARVRTFQVRMVLDCPDVVERASATRIDCTITDASLGGVTFKRERGLLQPILDELDDKLTDAHLQIVVTDKGRVRQVRLKDAWVHAQRNRRINEMNEVLRLVAARAVAGFDLVMPHEGNASGDTWGQHTDLIFGAPSLSGTRGSVDVLHRAEAASGGKVLITTGGRGTMIPGPSSIMENIFMGDVQAHAVFDTERGMLVERTWNMAVMPTPSSPLAQGWAGIPYAQRGALRLLGPDEQPDVGESREWVPSSELPPTTLQRMPFAWSEPGRDSLWGTLVVNAPETMPGSPTSGSPLTTDW